MPKTQTVVTIPGQWRTLGGRLSRDEAIDRVRFYLEAERARIDEQLAAIDRWGVVCWRGNTRLPVSGSGEEGSGDA